MSPPRPSFLERHGRRMGRFRWAVIPLFVLPVVLLILLISFGSVVGALLPLLTAAATIVLAMVGTTLAGERGGSGDRPLP